MEAVNIDGVANARDFGGYATASGRQVVRGKLFRSAHLAQISEDGICQLHDLGIRTICDFRHEKERTEWPTPPLGDTVAIEVLPIQSETLPGFVLDDIDFTTLQGWQTFTLRTNRSFVDRFEAEFGRWVELVLTTNDGVLVHCMSGKDRTGMAAAVVLSALGVPEETVLADYLLSNERLDLPGMYRQHVERGGPEMSPENWVALRGVQADYLQASLSQIQESWGSMEAYLDGALGVGRKETAALQDRLLV